MLKALGCLLVAPLLLLGVFMVVAAFLVLL